MSGIGSLGLDSNFALFHAAWVAKCCHRVVLVPPSSYQLLYRQPRVAPRSFSAKNMRS